MALDILENSDLSALGASRMQVSKGNNGFYGFIGIGEGKVAEKKASNVAQNVAKVGLDNPIEYRKRMMDLYNRVKGEAKFKGIAIQRLNEPNGLVIVKKLVDKFGYPTSAKLLKSHNNQYEIFSKYFGISESSSCAELNRMLNSIDFDLKELSQNDSDSDGYKSALDVVRTEVLRFMQITKCESDADKAERLSLEQAEGALKQSAQSSAAASKKIRNYILIGGGVILLVGLFTVLKRK